MINQFTFDVLKVTDKFHNPFESTWIQAETSDEAQEILARTYAPKYGFQLVLKRDLNASKLRKDFQKSLDLSLNSANL